MLDGNAIGGQLIEVFGEDLTAAQAICGSCGASGPVAALAVYPDAPGTVVRCHHCEAVVMVFTEVHGVTGVDVTGLSSLGAFEVLCRHVRDFNRGVRTGDFGAMVAEFTDEAEMVFDGIPAGPFRGRAQIAAAYAGSPPDDTIRLLRCARGDSSAVADFAWSADPGVLAGHMELRFDGTRISRLAITYLR